MFQGLGELEYKQYFLKSSQYKYLNRRDLCTKNFIAEILTVLSGWHTIWS